jgi:hypothetical protein
MMVKRIGFLLLFLCYAEVSFAQLILDFSPKGSRFPRELIKIEQVELASSAVTDSFQFSIGDSSLAISDQTTALNLGFLYYSQSKRTVSYQGFDSSSALISTGDAFAISKPDLPTELYKEYGYLGIPIWLGSSRLNVYYGQLTVSDKKDLTAADIIRYLDLEFYLTPEAESTWLFGWYYADAFGGIYNVPFLGYLSKSDKILAVQVVVPVKWSVGLALESGWVLGIGQQIEGEAYRLTEKPPWNSAIVSFSRVKSVAGIGYHFNSGLYLRVEGGILSQQKVQFYQESISISPAEVSEETYLSGDYPLLELTLADTSFYGISLAWAF